MCPGDIRESSAYQLQRAIHYRTHRLQQELAPRTHRWQQGLLRSDVVVFLRAYVLSALWLARRGGVDVFLRSLARCPWGGQEGMVLRARSCWIGGLLASQVHPSASNPPTPVSSCLSSLYVGTGTCVTSLLRTASTGSADSVRGLMCWSGSRRHRSNPSCGGSVGCWRPSSVHCCPV